MEAMSVIEAPKSLVSYLEVAEGGPGQQWQKKKMAGGGPEGPHRDSQWDLPGPLVYQTMQGDVMGETSSVWIAPWLRDPEAPVEEQVELEDNDYEDEDEDWGPCLAALEKGQQKIQQNWEEVMLTILEIVV
ncbi:UNVERIFIED_CONTAM: hypothetical protein K2H54_069745 [Gekko kuhli]